MNKRIFIFLFIIGALCLCGCADDFATKINLDGNSSEGEFNSEAALYGTVQDNYGKPIAGVLVSDGMQTTETDAKGNWQLFSDLKLRRFVFVTIPAGYEVPSKNGIPQFWQRIPENEKQFKGRFYVDEARRLGRSVYDFDDGRSADPRQDRGNGQIHVPFDRHFTRTCVPT